MGWVGLGWVQKVRGRSEMGWVCLSWVERQYFAEAAKYGSTHGVSSGWIGLGWIWVGPKSQRSD